MAYWYMDDGSLCCFGGQEDRAGFAVCGFTEEDCEVLISGLRRYGISSVYFRDSEGYSRLRLNADASEKLFLLIAPYVPTCMQYKLPERHRGHQAYLPSDTYSYEPLLMPQTVKSVEKASYDSRKYDIETETHNFFANRILVHNSNARIGLVLHPDESGNAVWTLMAGSHSVRRKRFNDKGVESIFWKPIAAIPILAAMLGHLRDQRDAKTSVIAFGEIFGPGIQDMAYGETKPSFRCFDVAVDGGYLQFGDLQALLWQFSIPTVPLLYRGPYSKEIVTELTDGHTRMCNQEKAGKFGGREGVVVRSNGPERKIMKSISVDYLARRGGTEYR